MAKLRIHFNYKSDYRRAFINSITPTILAIALLAISNATFDIYSNKSFDILVVYHFIVIRSLIWIPIVISFSTFVRGLCKRFAMLNSLLRFNQ